MENEWKLEDLTANISQQHLPEVKSARYPNLSLMSLSQLLYYALIGRGENAGLAA